MPEVLESLNLTAVAEVQGLDVHSIVFDSLCLAAAAKVPYPVRGLNSLYSKWQRGCRAWT